MDIVNGDPNPYVIVKVISWGRDYCGKRYVRDGNEDAATTLTIKFIIWPVPPKDSIVGVKYLRIIYLVIQPGFSQGDDFVVT